MKPTNFPNRKKQKRTIALNNLKKRPSNDKNKAEIKVLEERIK